MILSGLKFVVILVIYSKVILSYYIIYNKYIRKCPFKSSDLIIC